MQETLWLDDEAIYELEGYMDFEKHGQDCMENDCVTKTEFGLLRRLDPPFPEQRQGQQMFRKTLQQMCSMFAVTKKERKED